MLKSTLKQIFHVDMDLAMVTVLCRGSFRNKNTLQIIAWYFELQLATGIQIHLEAMFGVNFVLLIPINCNRHAACFVLLRHSVQLRQIVRVNLVEGYIVVVDGGAETLEMPLGRREWRRIAKHGTRESVPTQPSEEGHDPQHKGNGWG